MRVIVAARGGPCAKTRLAPYLDRAARHALTEAMLEAMLRALKPLSIVVVSPTPSLLSLTRSHGAVAVEQAAGNLNDAFRLGAAGARSNEITACLPGDLPLINCDELRSAADAARANGAAIVASHADGGTGALVMRRGLGLEPAFGSGSFARHVEKARTLGVAAPVFSAPSLSADIDTLAHLRALPPHILSCLAPGSVIARGQLQ